MKEEKRKKIAIIGSGASGVTSLIQLVQKQLQIYRDISLDILIFEKKEEWGKGMAFGTGQEDHLLNTKSHLMGIFPKEINHFVSWLKENKKRIHSEYPDVSVNEEGFVPRMLYGMYLQEQLETYIEKGTKEGISIETIQGKVVAAQISINNQAILRLENGDEYPVDFAILATGNPDPSAFIELNKYPNYVKLPWPSSRLLQTIEHKKSSVAIIGSSLTAIDALLTLTENGHKGKIIFCSLEGLLPRVQSKREVDFERKYLTVENAYNKMRQEKRGFLVKHLFELFKKEAEAASDKKINWKKQNRIGKDPLKLLKEDIRLAKKQNNLFLNILYSIRYESYEFWKLLDDDQKLLFIRTLKTDSDINRHAMPLINANKIKKLLESGQLEIVGDTDDVVYKKNKFVVMTKSGKKDVDYVINASGPESDVKKIHDQPLIEDLLNKGYIAPHPAGGILANLNTMNVISPTRKRPSPFYVVGHLLSGLQIDVNSLWFNVEQTHLMTDDVLQKTTAWKS